MLAIAAGTALATGGCGPTIIDVEDDGADAGTNASAEGTMGTTSGAESAEADVTSAGEDGMEVGEVDGGPKFDVGGIPPDPGMHECFDFPPPEPICDVTLLSGQQLGMRCVPEVQGSCEGVDSESVWNEAQNCLACSGFVDGVPCGPVSSGFDTCCFWLVYTEGQSCPGRPFTVDGEPRLPRVVEREDWAQPLEPSVDDCTPAVREALARGWAQDGCFEHASVASFSRFVMELLVLGAPPSLLADAQRALGEEVEHARAFFGLASAYGRRPVGPEGLDVRDALQSSHDPVAIAVALAHEGCIAETISSLQLSVAAARATDPVVRARLEAIADEELRHAELAWRALAWMMARGDDQLRTRVAETFADATSFIPRASDGSDELPDEVLRAHGRLSAEERLTLAERALVQLVAPAASHLLGPWTVTADAPEKTGVRSSRLRRSKTEAGRDAVAQPEPAEA